MMTELPAANLLEAYFTERMPAYLELLRQMVEVNSFTANAVGVNRLGGLTAEAFGRIGLEPTRVPSQTPLFGDHQILKTAIRQDRPTIGLVSHLDTVFPPDEEAQNDFRWRVEGKRIYGPGTVDIKGGTVMIYMILSALKELAADVFETTNWVVLLNAAEEELDPGFGQVCRQHLPADTLAALVFEGGRIRDGRYAVVTARKGRATFRIEVEGRAAHAGSAHKQGANAIVQMAETIRQVNRITDYRKRLTLNVGTVAGGSVINRVPHLACASGEMRAFNPEVLDGGIAALQAVASRPTLSSAKGDFNCAVNVEVLNRWSPWPPNAATERLADIWTEAGKSLGWEVNREHRGGLSDGNQIWDYVPVLDGLGPAGGNAHCSERSADGSKDQEYVRVNSIVPKAVLNALGILYLLMNRSNPPTTGE